MADLSHPSPQEEASLCLSDKNDDAVGEPEDCADGDGDAFNATCQHFTKHRARQSSVTSLISLPGKSSSIYVIRIYVV
jgi:hypothetical protein